MDIPDNIFTFNPEVPWRVDQSFNTRIDFCIWVLEIDGLRVPPFDQHPEGNRILQNKGLNADSWQQWLATVVNLQDSLLMRYAFYPDLSLLIEEDLNSINWMYLELTQYPEWSNQQIDLSAIRSGLENQYSIYERRYQALIAQLSHLPGNPIDYIEYIDKPFDVFSGSTEIREILTALWESYRQIRDQERVETLSQRVTTNSTGDTSKIWGLDYLNIYQVRYPIPVEYFIPPASVIISLANNLGSNDEFYALVERAAVRFSQTND